MKIVYFILLSFLITSCISSKKAKIDNLFNKGFVSQTTYELRSKGKIAKSPLVVIDGEVFKYSDYRKGYKPLTQSDVKEFTYFPKDSQTSYNIFGKISKGGVLVITTNSFNEPKTLILLDGKKISMEEFVRLNPSDFESFEVIEKKEDINKYTTEECDGIMIIKLKKKDN
jgi:hypothetical protein